MSDTLSNRLRGMAAASRSSLPRGKPSGADASVSLRADIVNALADLLDEAGGPTEAGDYIRWEDKVNAPARSPSRPEQKVKTMNERDAACRRYVAKQEADGDACDMHTERIWSYCAGWDEAMRSQKSDEFALAILQCRTLDEAQVLARGRLEGRRAQSKDSCRSTSEAMTDDWTLDPTTRRSNSNARFRELVSAVEELIRNSAHAIVGGRLEMVAGLIVAQLAHKHGLAPRDEARDRSEGETGP